MYGCYGKVIRLSNFRLDAALYYVNKDIPVLAALEGDKAVLVIGFNEYNVVLMDPEAGAIYKMGLNDAAKLFQDNGNSFVTYVMED